jgi:hypothetical protein
MRLLEIAGNRWRNQMVADLRKVMKLNRHNSLLKSGRIAENRWRSTGGDAGAGKARRGAAPCERMQEHFRNGLEAAASASERRMRHGPAPTTCFEKRAAGCSSVTTSASGSTMAGLSRMRYGL